MMQAAWLVQRDALHAVSAMLSVASSGRRRRSSRRGLLHQTVFAVDWLLRRWYGVQEFTGDSACLLRVASATASAAVYLADGTELAPGDPILELHLWNEQLPRYRGSRDGLAWAARFRAALEHSLRLLAAEIAVEPALAEPRALRAETAFVTRGRARKLARIAAHYGFAAPRTASAGSARPRRDLGGDLLIFGLTLACNPLSLRGKPLRRERHELWISRERLLALYRPLPAIRGEATTSASERQAAA